jgi:hypothetical protein
MKGVRPEKFREKVYVSTRELEKMIEKELAVLKGDERAESETVN